MVIIAWIIFYFYASFHTELAWGSCSNDFNTDGKDAPLYRYATYIYYWVFVVCHEHREQWPCFSLSLSLCWLMPTVINRTSCTRTHSRFSPAPCFVVRRGTYARHMRAVYCPGRCRGVCTTSTTTTSTKLTHHRAKHCTHAIFFYFDPSPSFSHRLSTACILICRPNNQRCVCT